MHVYSFSNSMWLSSFQSLPTNRTKINKPRWYPPLTWAKSWILNSWENSRSSRDAAQMYKHWKKNSFITVNRELKSKDDVEDNKKRQLKMLLCVSTIILYFLFQVLTVAKCALSILQLNCNPYFRYKKKKSEICRHVLTSSTLRHNISRRRKGKNGYEM